MPEPYRFQFPIELWNYCKEAAAPLNVTPVVDPHDYMFEFIVAIAKTPREGVFNYFNAGSRAAQSLIEIVQSYRASADATEGTMLRILEFASGYGRMTRHLIHRLPNTELVCCDIHEQAVKFLEQVLGVRSKLSSKVPAEFMDRETYDVVTAISFFSHIPEPVFRPWIHALFDRLRPTGHFIFTTHGRPFLRRVAADLYAMPELPPTGFFFAPTSEQKDLDEEEYGAMFVSEEFVASCFQGLGVAGFAFQEGFWGGQDLYVVQKA